MEEACSASRTTELEEQVTDLKDPDSGEGPDHHPGKKRPFRSREAALASPGSLIQSELTDEMPISPPCVAAKGKADPPKWWAA